MTIKQLDAKYPHIRLMPYQWEPFNGDKFLCEEILKLRDKYRIQRAIELGTCLGSTALWLAEHFNRVETTEIEEKFFLIAEERILESGYDVGMWLADSRSVLDVLIPSSQPYLIFIDSHWGPSNPLLQELDIIAQVGNRNVVIVIHDFLVPDRPDFGYDTYPAQNIVYEWGWIKSRIEKIYGADGYNHYYNREATGAQRGVVFIEPKNI